MSVAVFLFHAQTDPVADSAYIVGILTKTADPLTQAVVADEISQRLPRARLGERQPSRVLSGRESTEGLTRGPARPGFRLV